MKKFIIMIVLSLTLVQNCFAEQLNCADVFDKLLRSKETEMSTEDLKKFQFCGKEMLYIMQAFHRLADVYQFSEKPAGCFTFLYEAVDDGHTYCYTDGGGVYWE